MSYESLDYDQLCLKASHNSYQRDEPLLDQIAWDDVEHYNCGCRSLELDIVRHSDDSGGTSETYFQVTHEQGGNGPTLASYLADLLDWHDKDSAHDPILVALDIKSEEGSASAFVDEIDAYLTAWFRAELIFAPGAILGHSTEPLLQAIQQKGWPPLGDIKGRFLFCLSGNEDWKKLYAKTDPALRLCFADQVIAYAPFDPIPDADDTDDHRPVVNLHLYSDQYGWWKSLVAQLRARHFLVRGWVLNSGDLWDKAQGAGVNLLATDKISGHDWACVGSEPFAPSAPPAT